MTMHFILLVKMLFTHSAVQKIVSQISDLRCWMFQSGLCEKGSEVVFLNEHVYLSIFVLRCGCQPCRSVDNLNPKRMITVKQFEMISVSIRVLGREPWSSIATNLLFIASFSQGPRAVFDLGSIGRARWGSPEKNKHSSQKGRFVQPGMASVLLSHRCPPPGVLPATQLCWDLGLFDQVDGRTWTMSTS